MSDEVAMDDRLFGQPPSEPQDRLDVALQAADERVAAAELLGE